MEMVWLEAVYIVNGLQSSRKVNLTWRINYTLVNDKNLEMRIWKFSSDDNHTQSTLELADKSGANHWTIVRCLQSMGKFLKNGKICSICIVRAKHETIYISLLVKHENKFLKTVTGDENWVCYDKQKH